MLKRGSKIAIIISIVALALVGITLTLYFVFFKKDSYQLVDVEATEFSADDFTKTSKLVLNQNNTFSIRIEHKTKGLSLTGIGKYTLDGKTYKLTFIKVFARDINDSIVDITEEAQDITCTRSGNRIKFTDHKFQTYYFG